MPPIPRKQKPLTEAQLRLLLETPEADRPKVFPGYTREFLKAERRRGHALLPATTRIELDQARATERAKLREAERLYQAARTETVRLREQVSQLQAYPPVEPRDLKIEAAARGSHEATAVVLASDWHCEEEVTTEATEGYNRYDLKVFDKRAGWFFQNVVKLVRKEAQAVAIKNLVLGVLGDMISGSIHEDLAESNLLGPMQAIALAQDTVAGGVQLLLRELPDIKITLVHKWGNHSRTTKKQRIQTEHENSLEWLMAHAIRREFAAEPRVKVVAENSLLTHLDIHGWTVRFLHGHAVNYQGGVGGITIPINKAVAQWDKQRAAHLTCMGHFHQLTFGSGFVVNGSLIGHNAFATWIKAAPEPPRQAFFLIDSQHGLTVRAPVLLEEA